MKSSQAGRFLSELQPDDWTATLATGVISGVVTTVFSISLVGLIFRGPLVPLIPNGVGWFLLGAVLLGLCVAVTSSYAGNIATPQGKTGIVLALAAASLAEVLTPEQRLPTLFALMLVTSLLTGVGLFALGYFRLGNLTRFLPYPVIGGFQVGTGWLIFVGAFSVLTGDRLTLANLPALSTWDAVARWGPALAYAVVMMVVLQLKPHFLTLSALLGAGVVVCHAIFWAGGTPLPELRADGWLLGPFPAGRAFEVPELGAVAWGALAQQTPTILVAVLLVATDVLLNSAAIEVSTNARLDLDQELKSTGLGNFAAGWVGGLAGYSAISLVLLNHRVGASSRMTAILSALVCGVFLVVGIPLLDQFPVTVLGGLLLFIGLAFMKDWVWSGRDRLSRLDYALLLVIWGLIAVFGFLEGVSAGLLIAMAIFIVTYSRTDVVKLELTGAQLRSNRERLASETRLLEAHGEALHALKLQGFVFFGTAHGLLERCRALFETPRAEPLQALIVDFRAVTGIDSSAVASFRQMAQLSATHGTRLLFSSVPDDLGAALDHHGLRGPTHEAVGSGATLDLCVEWWEDALLQAHPEHAHTLDAALGEAFSADEAAAFRQHLVRRDLEAGEVLFAEGSPSDSLVFIESGLLVATISDAFGHEERVRSFGAGAIVGEMGLYTKAPRSAKVLAAEASTVHLLSREALQEIASSAPELATALHVSIARTLAHRLGQANTTLKYLLK